MCEQSVQNTSHKLSSFFCMLSVIDFDVCLKLCAAVLGLLYNVWGCCEVLANIN